MNWRDFMTLTYFVVTAIIFGVVGWVTLSPAIKWVAPIVTLGFISVGLGVDRLVYTDRKIEPGHSILNSSIQRLQEEMQKEQKEQSTAGTPVIPTLQAFSQLYFDYLAKQEGGNEQ